MTTELEIKGNEKFKVTSQFINISGSAILVLFLLAGILAPKVDFWGAFFFGILFGAGFIWLGNLLYMFTPLFWKKQKKVDEIYEHFKKRFHVLNAFDPEKHEKLDEYNEDKIKYSKEVSNDEIMFNAYMKAHNTGADAVILDSLNQNQIRCMLIKYIK